MARLLRPLLRHAERIKGWRAEGRDVFACFNHDEMGYAPKNALRLRELASD